MKLHTTQLPAPESEVRAALARYKAALAAHTKTVGEPAPWPEYECLRNLVNDIEGLIVETDPEPTPAPTPSTEELEARQLERALAVKRAAAIEAALAYVAAKADGPAAVKDYAATKG